MEISQLIPHVEALIFAADRPLPAADILELLNNALAFLEDRATPEQVAAAIEAIQEKYSSEFYAFSVRESGGGYQFLTKKEYYQTVAQINGEKFLKRLSTAALETLAIIAYKQPISKGEIEHIRGVSTDYSITKLLEKELIVISGRSEELPGKPLLYSTSKAFMDYFGLNSPADLPKLREVFEEDFVPPTQLTLEAVETLEVDEEALTDGHLIITETGELTETTTIVMEDEPSEEHITTDDGNSGGSGDDDEGEDDPHASGNSAGGDPEMADSGEDLEDELDEDGEIEAMLGGEEDEDEEGGERKEKGDDDDEEEEEDDDDDDEDEEDDDEDDDDDDDEEDEDDDDDEESEDDDKPTSGNVPFEEDPYDKNDQEKADDEEQETEDADDRLNDEEDEDEDAEGKEERY